MSNLYINDVLKTLSFKIDIYFLTWLNYHDDRTDIGYRQKRGLNSFTQHQIYYQSYHFINS